MTDATVKVLVDGTSATITIRGEIDLANYAAVEERLNRAISNQAELVRVDLAGVTFIDSAGLRVLFSLAARLDRLQVELEIRAPEASPARRVAEMSGLSTLVRLIPDGG